MPCCRCQYLLQLSPSSFLKALRTLFVDTEPTILFPFRTSNVIRSVRSSHLLLSSKNSRPSSAKVSARSLMGSPRCDFTLIRKIALPALTRCVCRQFFSCRMSASGAVASFALPSCPTHFHKQRWEPLVGQERLGPSFFFIPFRMTPIFVSATKQGHHRGGGGGDKGRSRRPADGSVSCDRTNRCGCHLRLTVAVLACPQTSVCQAQERG
jgi:hypothetical protein